MARLDQEERELLESFERDEWSIPGREVETERYREYARVTFKKDERVNIRMSGKDLEAIKTRALEEGIPYQTLMSSVLHKYAEGRLVEKRGRPEQLAQVGTVVLSPKLGKDRNRPPQFPYFQFSHPSPFGLVPKKRANERLGLS